MNDVRVSLITNSSDLVPVDDDNYFHSCHFFTALEHTPGMSPCMAVATLQDGTVVGHMLATTVTRRWLLMPLAVRHGRVYGEGCYTAQADKEMVFGMMLHAITKRFKRELCLYAELSNISQKMFGYRSLRRCGYVPVPWQEIHNSLHSMPPWQRLTAQQREDIEAAERQGVSVRPCNGDGERHEYIKLLRRHFMLKGRRHIPHERLFDEIERDGHAVHLVTTYKGRIIGGCTLVFSQGDACLWFMASRRKTFRAVHPALMTVWGALKYAHDAGCAHIRFLDAGLPVKPNPYREFVLSFGGKPTAKYRWFRLPWGNRLVRWLYGE